jgi:formaldehyde-activating enzyme involved in methanogenesis|tara:strand:- start:194 stop:454 length:261 start_codon:yes stop_codon:yes gene_type:complete
MVSSIREKMWSVEKEKKRQRRLAKEGVVDAIEERIIPKDDKQEHTQVEEREVPTETSDSDSVIESGEIKAKINKPKKKSKKATKKE